MRGATSKRRHRPSENAEFSSQDQVLHSTAISDDVPMFDPHGFVSPVQISAPSGYPYFTRILQEHGFFVAKPRNHLEVHQLMFRQALRRFLRTAKNQDRLKFINEFQGYLNESENLYHSITPTLHQDEILQESLLHSILNIPELHKIGMDAILPAIMDTSCSASNQESIDTLEEMLGQLRWIDYPNVESCISFLIGTIEGATNLARQSILKFLPEIVPASQHSRLLSTLKDLLETADSPIVSAIMECLSCLDISSTDWAENQQFAIAQLLNAPLQDFPSYFAFLLKTENNSNLSETIAELRENLELVAIGGTDPENEVAFLRIIQKIRSCTSVNPRLVPTWILQITNDLDGGAENLIKPLDLIMLLIFIEASKEALIPLRRICVNRKLSVKLFEYTIANNLPVLSQVHKTFVRFCESILRSPKEVAAHVAIKQIVIKLFLALNQMEVESLATNLISILASGDLSARTSVLQIFSEISLLRPTKLLPCASQLMVLLEGNSSFSTQQVRSLMNILASMAYVEGSVESEQFGNEYSVFLQKGFTQARTANRCVGVFGCLASIHELAMKAGTTNAEDRINEFLNLTWSYVKREEDLCCLFFDELSNIAKALPETIKAEFRELMFTSFLENWCHLDTRDLSDNNQTKQLLKLKEQFLPGPNTENADEDFEWSERDSSQPNRQLLVFEDRPRGMSPRGIPAHARLLFQLISNKTDVKNILTKSLLFPEISRYYKNPEDLEACNFGDRQRLGVHILTAINFFRECISACVQEKDEMIQIYVWYRLYNVISLQQLFAQNIQHIPSLPTAYVSERKMGLGTGGDLPPGSTDFKKPKPPGSRTKKAMKSKKRKREDVKVDDNEDEVDESVKELFGLTVSSVQPAEISVFLRRLDPAVFKLLQSPLKLDGPVNFDQIWQQLTSGAKDVKKICEGVKQLYPDALCLMLMEINQRNGDPDTPFSLLDVDSLIKCVTIHLNSIVVEFENSSQLRGIRKFEECVQLILNTLSTYFDKVVKLEDSVQRENLYGEILGALTVTAEFDEGTEAEDEQIHAAVAFLKKVSGCIKKPARALDHVKAVNNFQALFPDNEVARIALVDIAESYMNADWKLSSTQVDFMLKAWIQKSADPISVMRAVTSSLIQPDYGNLAGCTSANFHTYYSVLFQLLAQHMVKNGKRATTSGDGFKFWKEAVLMFKELVFVSETHRTRNILTPLMKHSRAFIESFTTNGTTLLPSVYQEDLPEFKHFVRNLQMATRKLQVICEHSKVVKDIKLIRNEPQLKRALEGLVFRVRELFMLNRISDVFCLGSLRHRNMDGEEVSSQPFNQPDPRYCSTSDDSLNDETVETEPGPESSTDSEVELEL